MSTRTLPEKIARLAARTHARLDPWLERPRRALRDATTGLLMGLLDEAGREAMTAAAYSTWRGNARTGLFDWEERLLARVLPGAPARLLLGGAGHGREARELVARGYRVFAYDPSPASAPALSALGFAASDRAVASHGALASAMLDHDPASPLACLEGDSFDAVWFGWGSFVHVIGHENRVRAIRAARVASPGGPVVVSYWASAALPGTGRARQVAFQAARRLGRGDEDDAAVVFTARAGFGAYLTVADVERIASDAGERIEWPELPSNGSSPGLVVLRPR